MKYIISISVFLGVGLSVYAAESEVLEFVEPYVEILNLFVAFLVIVASLRGLKQAGGMIRESWNFVVLTAFFFLLVELKGVLAEFHIYEFSDADALEFLAISSLLISVRRLQKLFQS